MQKSKRMLEHQLALPSGFSLHDTLTCGQSFRWKLQNDGSFAGVVGGCACRLESDGKTLFVTCQNCGLDQNFWIDYFDLDGDYGRWHRMMDGYEALKPVVEWSSGIRLLRQNSWETLISFIISQNNHIPRIEGIIERLCEVCSGGEDLAFPTPKQIVSLSPQQLKLLRCGYRERYIVDAADKVISGVVNLTAAKELPADNARDMLMQITGVGPKVADCVLLYGLGHLECCPVDVWIKRGLKTVLPNGIPKPLAPIAGIVQLYLFHYMRTCPDAPRG
jgi:N-glycosylase/DNA lyase